MTSSMDAIARLTILHLSDIHAGPPGFQSHVADCVVEDAQRLQPTLTVISGDLVLREWESHFQQARAFVERLPRPRLIVPGNHDLPIWHFWEALFDPLRRYRRYFGDDEPFFNIPGLAVVGLNSTLPFVSSGHISRRELERMAARLKGLPPDTCRVVVVHHHFVPPPQRTSPISSLVLSARRALDAFEDAGVELVLTGHMHRAFIGNSLDFRRHARRGSILVQAGTVTSPRGRLSERLKNTYNLIQIDGEQIVVTHYMYFTELGRFAALSRHIFPRRLQIPYYLRE
jgi:3',5'-cyclic AMP phosphodiesterase CpdA